MMQRMDGFNHIPPSPRRARVWREEERRRRKKKEAKQDQLGLTHAPRGPRSAALALLVLPLRFYHEC